MHNGEKSFCSAQPIPHQMTHIANPLNAFQSDKQVTDVTHRTGYSPIRLPTPLARAPSFIQTIVFCVASITFHDYAVGFMARTIFAAVLDSNSTQNVQLARLHSVCLAIDSGYGSVKMRTENSCQLVPHLMSFWKKKNKQQRNLCTEQTCTDLINWAIGLISAWPKLSYVLCLISRSQFRLKTLYRSSFGVVCVFRHLSLSPFIALNGLNNID